MGDQIVFQPGAYPWQPTEDADLERLFHKYNYPLAGVIRQAGNRFLFARIEDVLDEWSVWAYVLVEEKDLDLFKNPEVAREYIEREAPHPVYLVVARDTKIEFMATAPPPTSDEPFLSAVLESLSTASDAFREVEELTA